ncbi:aspartate ammonia-lyase [Heliobacterium undosum]|uniref:Aspartate ammonia-lyase n=1 Tax=Heliomicrobium undosum TaxID=121734 RepID=A0A845L6N6_9FIRM|nr:aspartate ammonia-lyase [Heliomicrobium undosum]
MHRIERDLIGEKEIPADADYGIHTARADENFSVSSRTVHPELIKALAVVKRAAAEANLQLGFIDEARGKAIIQAAAEIAAGERKEQFIVDALQGGAGTSTNMNMNEVIANRAIEILGGQKGDYSRIHPINHVNLSQSTNDVYPTALRLAVLRLQRPLADACAALHGALREKEAQFDGVLKVGRTELQDAVPITLGQEFSAWAGAIARDRLRYLQAGERLRYVNLGGTAVGTGLNADRRYLLLVMERLRDLSGLDVLAMDDRVDGTQNADVFVEVSGLLKTNAASLVKLSSDLRLLSSGPRAGLAEIRIPPVQAGSTIMPGKVNPVMAEMLTQAAYDVMGRDLAVTLAAQAGQLELNAFLPLIADSLLPAMETLSRAMRLFAERCIRGITADEGRCLHHLQNSVSLIAALLPRLGYDQASALAKQAIAQNRSIRVVLLESGAFSERELDELLKPEELARPGLAKGRASS